MGIRQEVTFVDILITALGFKPVTLFKYEC